MEDCIGIARSRTKRTPGGDPFVTNKHFRDFISRLVSNDPTLGTLNGRCLHLKSKGYLACDASSPYIDMVLNALKENVRVEVLYIQNFEKGFKDQQLELLIEVLKLKRIWAVNVGENFGVTLEAWHVFAKALPETIVSYLYVSEHRLTSALKTQMRTALRYNRKILGPRDPYLCHNVTNMWYNPAPSQCECTPPQYAPDGLGRLYAPEEEVARRHERDIQRIEARKAALIAAGVPPPSIPPNPRHVEPTVQLLKRYVFEDCHLYPPKLRILPDAEGNVPLLKLPQKPSLGHIGKRQRLDAQGRVATRRSHAHQGNSNAVTQRGPGQPSGSRARVRSLGDPSGPVRGLNIPGLDLPETYYAVAPLQSSQAGGPAGTPQESPRVRPQPQPRRRSSTLQHAVNARRTKVTPRPLLVHAERFNRQRQQQAASSLRCQIEHDAAEEWATCQQMSDEHRQVDPASEQTQGSVRTEQQLAELRERHRVEAERQSTPEQQPWQDRLTEPQVLSHHQGVVAAHQAVQTRDAAYHSQGAAGHDHLLAQEHYIEQIPVLDACCAHGRKCAVTEGMPQAAVGAQHSTPQHIPRVQQHLTPVPPRLLSQAMVQGGGVCIAAPAPQQVTTLPVACMTMTSDVCSHHIVDDTQRLQRAFHAVSVDATAAPVEHRQECLVKSCLPWMAASSAAGAGRAPQVFTQRHAGADESAVLRPAASMPDAAIADGPRDADAGVASGIQGAAAKACVQPSLWANSDAVIAASSAAAHPVQPALWQRASPQATRPEQVAPPLKSAKQMMDALPVDASAVQPPLLQEPDVLVGGMPVNTVEEATVMPPLPDQLPVEQQRVVAVSGKGKPADSTSSGEDTGFAVGGAVGPAAPAGNTNAPASSGGSMASTGCRCPVPQCDAVTGGTAPAYDEEAGVGCERRRGGAHASSTMLCDLPISPRVAADEEEEEAVFVPRVDEDNYADVWFHVTCGGVLASGGAWSEDDSDYSDGPSGWHGAGDWALCAGGGVTGPADRRRRYLERENRQRAVGPGGGGHGARQRAAGGGGGQGRSNTRAGGAGGPQTSRGDGTSSGHQGSRGSARRSRGSGGGGGGGGAGGSGGGDDRGGPPARECGDKASGKASKGRTGEARSLLPRNGRVSRVAVASIDTPEEPAADQAEAAPIPEADGSGAEPAGGLEDAPEDVPQPGSPPNGVGVHRRGRRNSSGKTAAEVEGEPSRGSGARGVRFASATKALLPRTGRVAKPVEPSSGPQLPAAVQRVSGRVRRGSVRLEHPDDVAAMAGTSHAAGQAGPSGGSADVEEPPQAQARRRRSKAPIEGDSTMVAAIAGSVDAGPEELAVPTATRARRASGGAASAAAARDPVGRKPQSQGLAKSPAQRRRVGKDATAAVQAAAAVPEPEQPEAIAGASTGMQTRRKSGAGTAVQGQVPQLPSAGNAAAGSSPRKQRRPSASGGSQGGSGSGGPRSRSAPAAAATRLLPRGGRVQAPDDGFAEDNGVADVGGAQQREGHGRVRKPSVRMQSNQEAADAVAEMAASRRSGGRVSPRKIPSKATFVATHATDTAGLTSTVQHSGTVLLSTQGRVAVPPFEAGEGAQHYLARAEGVMQAGTSAMGLRTKRWRLSLPSQRAGLSEADPPVDAHRTVPAQAQRRSSHPAVVTTVQGSGMSLRPDRWRLSLPDAPGRSHSKDGAVPQAPQRSRGLNGGSPAAKRVRQAPRGRSLPVDVRPRSARHAAAAPRRAAAATAAVVAPVLPQKRRRSVSGTGGAGPSRVAAVDVGGDSATADAEAAMSLRPKRWRLPSPLLPGRRSASAEAHVQVATVRQGAGAAGRAERSSMRTPQKAVGAGGSKKMSQTPQRRKSAPAAAARTVAVHDSEPRLSRGLVARSGRVVVPHDAPFVAPLLDIGTAAVDEAGLRSLLPRRGRIAVPGAMQPQNDEEAADGEAEPQPEHAASARLPGVSTRSKSGDQWADAGAKQVSNGDKAVAGPSGVRGVQYAAPVASLEQPAGRVLPQPSGSLMATRARRSSSHFSVPSEAFENISSAGPVHSGAASGSLGGAGGRKRRRSTSGREGSMQSPSDPLQAARGSGLAGVPKVALRRKGRLSSQGGESAPAAAAGHAQGDNQLEGSV